MGIKIWIDGVVYDKDDAKVSVFDRGFLYGDSIYEVMRTSGGRPVDLDQHLERLGKSAAGLMLELPSMDVLRGGIDAALAAAGNDDSYIRVVVTRGAGEIGLDTALALDPTTIVIVKPIHGPSAEMYERGIKLEIVGVQRTSRRAIDPAVKSGNYLNSILALAEAKRAGADEALMCDAAGRVAEGSSSNVFVVEGGAIRTPGTEVGLLAGITRARVIGLARDAGISVSEGTILPNEVRGADEVFITSSMRGVLAVSHVDQRPIGTACPGPITRKIMDLYTGFLRRVAQAAE